MSLAMASYLRLLNGLRLAISAAVITVAAGGSGQAATAPAPHAAEVLRLWRRAAPGTASWTGTEAEGGRDIPGVGKIHVVTNVAVPTITVFRPPPGRASG